MNIGKNQIIKLSIAFRECNIDPAAKEAIYSAYGVKTKKHLTSEQADEILVFLESKYGWKPKISSNDDIKYSVKQFGYGKEKYKNLGNRDKNFAKPVKLRKIEVMWAGLSRKKTDESLTQFIKRLTGVNHITFLSNKNANTILAALNEMDKNAMS